MHADDLLIGIDVGSTTVKAALFDRSGACLAHWGRPYPTERPAPGVVEQDPAHWIAGVREGIAAVTAGVPSGWIRGIGLCSQVNTDVFVDADGRALAPAVFWQDGRAAPQSDRLSAAIPESTRLAWWGAPMPIGASHVLAKMSWMAEARPDVYGRTRAVLSPKDYCLLHLCGSAVTDPISAFGQVGADLRYIDPLLAMVPGAAERLPPLRGMHETVGTVDLDGHQVPVVTGTMDAWASLFGCGIGRAGEAMYMSGTSEILAVTADRRLPVAGVVGFPPVEGFAVSAGPTQSGADSLRWLAGIVGGTPAGIPGLAALADRDRCRVLFLPQLEGERAPLWDADLRGAFVGLDSRSAAPEFALAVLEGVALSARMLLDALRGATTEPLRELRHAGGGARSDLWCQIRADCLGVPIRRLAHVDAGCLGAAMLAGVGAGLYGSIAEAARSMGRTERLFEPDPARAARYDRLYESYRAAIAALRPIGRMSE
jgi:xylulokinase